MTKQVEVAYGRHGLQISVPSDADIINSRFVAGLVDEAAALRAALANPIGSPPLAELVKPGDTVVIVHSDITRATPNDRIQPVLIAALEEAGIRSQDITLLNALGTHRPQTDAELRRMLGDRIVDRYRCEQHNAFDDSILTPLGVTSRGNSVRVNRRYLEADVKILTGFIEPHFFAGFSGGPKGVLPALAGQESVLSNHGVAMIEHPNAIWGVTQGNPVWEEMLEVALMTNPTLLLNVTLNVHKEITGVFAGDLRQAHGAGCRFVQEQAMVAVDQPYDIVITGNSGYPLDQNLYQCVKGMSAARKIVRKGGTIIMAGYCEDGLPDHGKYGELLRRGGTPRGVLRMLREPDFGEQDQWQVQIQAQIQEYAHVYVYSDGLSDEQIRDALFVPTSSIEQTIDQLSASLDRPPRICVLPEGPQTVAYVPTRASEPVGV
jgi:nickel-dependent lactate racemase